MKLILNNNNEEIVGYHQISIAELLKVKKFTFKMLIIKINDVLVKKDEYEKIIVHEGDNVAVIHLISGG